jgi:hypothetical protein
MLGRGRVVSSTGSRGECAMHVLPNFERAENAALARGVSATDYLPGAVRSLQDVKGE